jgi:thioredoxin reductase (NADPH)
MSEPKPVILAVDDDPQVQKAIQRDLRKRFRSDYRVLSTTSPEEARDTLEELRRRNETVAMVVSDQRMPVMEGVELLHQSRQLYPDAKRVLLTAYSDTEAAIRAINEVQLDYYLMKPWDPPEEKLYPVLEDLLDEWQSHYQPALPGLKLLGYQFSPEAYTLRDFLAANLIPYQWIEVNTYAEAAQEILAGAGLTRRELPALVLEDQQVLARPSIATLAERLQLNTNTETVETLYDVVIVGAGPAGLAAAVYGSSEGLRTLLVEKKAPGGQAGTSSRIENYLGFPNGLSGADLSRRAIAQARRLGAEFLSPVEVRAIEVEDNYKRLSFTDGKQVTARALIIATGVAYRRHPAEGLHRFTGAGVYYGAATTEAGACRDKEVYIVGGGNSAGQAAMYLSRFARRVCLLVRKPDLSTSMSAYLIEQIDQQPNIDVMGNTEIVSASGEDRLESLCLQYTSDGTSWEVPTNHLFVFIGNKPMTEWLELPSLRKNAKGFVETGPQLKAYSDFNKIWKAGREPMLLETSEPGVFAAGDVRAGAMNRVASAVGEGSMSIKMVHHYLEG